MSDEKTIDIEQLQWVEIQPQLTDGLHKRPLSKRQIRYWSLVLESRRIPYRTTRTDNSWQLLVTADHYRLALEELQGYERENRNWPPPPPLVPQQYENTASTIWVLILFGLFHILAREKVPLFDHPPLDWYSLGSAHAGKILNGEWWRLVTALTLHSGGVHLTGNIVVGGIFINRLCRDLGSGLGWGLVLCSGLLGNLANAFVQNPGHRSIGASTAVFGAVGLLATINMLRYRRQLRHRWPLPVAAALGLLGLLGAGGENTDIGAHLFGFVFGMLLGFATERLLDRYGPVPVPVNYLIAFICTGLLFFCWHLALA